MVLSNSILVIGLGNRYRKDDGVGITVAENIKAMNDINVAIATNIPDSTDLIESWSGASIVFIVDAVLSGAEPGEIFRIDAFKEEIPEEIFVDCSTHALNLRNTFELAEVLEKLPESLIIYGIEGENFEAGVGLSPGVREAAWQVSEMINNEIENFSLDGMRIQNNA